MTACHFGSFAGVLCALLFVGFQKPLENAGSYSFKRDGPWPQLVLTFKQRKKQKQSL